MHRVVDNRLSPYVANFLLVFVLEGNFFCFLLLIVSSCQEPEDVLLEDQDGVDLVNPNSQAYFEYKNSIQVGEPNQFESNRPLTIDHLGFNVTGRGFEGSGFRGGLTEDDHSRTGEQLRNWLN